MKPKKLILEYNLEYEKGFNNCWDLFDKHIKGYVSEPTLKQIDRCIYENGHKTIEEMSKAIKQLIDKEELSVSEELRKNLKQNPCEPGGY